MSLRYLSVCSGIEAASVAWHGLGWTPVAFAEVEPFPSAVLAHRFPGVPNWGDMTKFKEWPDADIDILVGGTPCQSFSVAGLRKGLEDPRGSLMLTYLAIARRYRPRYVVWENVPGVLSSNGGRDFGTFLGALGDLGYGWAYRVLDAQWFGVPQRRRRVFVVGCLGDARSAAAVLFEREGVRRDSPPRREAGQAVAGSLTSRASGGGGGPGAGTDEACAGYLQPVAHWPASVAPTLNAAFGGKQGLEDQHALGGAGLFVPTVMSSGQANASVTANVTGALDCLHEAPIVAHSLRGEGFDASEDGTGRGTPLVPVAISEAGDVASTLRTGGNDHADIYNCIAFSAKDHGADAGDLAPTLRAMGSRDGRPNGGGRVAVAVALRGREGGATAELGDDKAHALRASTGGGDKPHVMTTAVRRLTPTECERLQGFPDGWTDIPWRGKPTAPDGPRYKALGNSMAVPCMRWLGERIDEAEVFS